MIPHSQVLSWMTVNGANMDSNVYLCVTEARTFGHHFLKRISFAVVPAAFVVGMITTLLAALTVVSIKGLGVGVSFPEYPHMICYCYQIFSLFPLFEQYCAVRFRRRKL